MKMYNEDQVALLKEEIRKRAILEACHMCRIGEQEAWKLAKKNKEIPQKVTFYATVAEASRQLEMLIGMLHVTTIYIPTDEPAPELRPDTDPVQDGMRPAGGKPTE